MPHSLVLTQDESLTTEHQTVFVSNSIHPSVPEGKLILVQYRGGSTNTLLIGVHQKDSIGTKVLWRDTYPNFTAALQESAKLFGEAQRAYEILQAEPTVGQLLQYINGNL